MAILFEDNESGYRKWLQEHFSGFVVNLKKKPSDK